MDHVKTPTHNNNDDSIRAPVDYNIYYGGNLINNRTRKASESFSTSSQESYTYDPESTTAIPNRNFFRKLKSNVKRAACNFLGKLDSDSYNFGDYPLGNDFKDWETW